ncbi:MAG TPA: gamma-glutamylcyclotransferase family protein [Variovorax sp.]|nr:gamma-glutamylcyclotransferase family protein [Variovorax sp.]
MPEASTPAAAPRHVFVYGTLRAGGSNDIACFRPAAHFVGPGEIAGTLYHLGAYPGAILGGSGHLQGEVYRIEPALEAQLDLLEEVMPNGEGEYRKRQVPVLVGARPLDCLVYEIHPRRVAGRPVIASGDWLARG